MALRSSHGTPESGFRPIPLLHNSLVVQCSVRSFAVMSIHVKIVVLGGFYTNFALNVKQIWNVVLGLVLFFPCWIASETNAPDLLPSIRSFFSISNQWIVPPLHFCSSCPEPGDPQSFEWIVLLNSALFIQCPLSIFLLCLILLLTFRC